MPPKKKIAKERKITRHIDVKMDCHNLKRVAKHLAFNEPPQDPPCEGGVWISWATTTRCIDGVVHYIDTVVWKCPDGTTKTVKSDTPTKPPVPC
jgi:hypothetical protein